MEEGDLFWKLGLNNRYLLRKKKTKPQPILHTLRTEYISDWRVKYKIKISNFFKVNYTICIVIVWEKLSKFQYKSQTPSKSILNIL